MVMKKVIENKSLVTDRKKVLVVDDDAGILDAISIILKEEGYEVDTAFKGEETLKKAYSFRPDIILLDVLMSGKDGRDICMNFKSNPITKEIPVIMISAHPGAKASIKECGADDFLAKPFDVVDLLSIIKKHIL
jgi:DNA-binding response OmpR family regulator